MPDITMCQPGGRCKDKEKCYRFTARADTMHQSYACFAPHDGSTTDTKKCDRYWDDEHE